MWAITTTHKIKKWYVFEEMEGCIVPYTLVDIFDPKIVPVFKTKKQAKEAAKCLPIDTWSYTKVTI